MKQPSENPIVDGQLEGMREALRRLDGFQGGEEELAEIAVYLCETSREAKFNLIPTDRSDHQQVVELISLTRQASERLQDLSENSDVRAACENLTWRSQRLNDRMTAAG